MFSHIRTEQCNSNNQYLKYKYYYTNIVFTKEQNELSQIAQQQKISKSRRLATTAVKNSKHPDAMDRGRTLS
jgi:hypothetical protein